MTHGADRAASKDPGRDRREESRALDPEEPTVDRLHWLRCVVTIAAYRERHRITSRDPLGGQPADDSQRLDRARAEAAIGRIRGTARPQPHRVASGHDGLSL